jgi:hypothetical protein
MIVVTEKENPDIVEVIAVGPQGPSGLGGSIANYGSFYDNTTQTLVSSNVEQRIRIGSTLVNLNIDLVDNKIVFREPGTYSLTFSLQFTNSANNAVHTAKAWIKYQGTAYPNSASYFAIPSSRQGVPGELIGTVNFVATATGENDYVELFWTADTQSVSLTTIGPFGTIPAAPCVILTVVPVIYNQSNDVANVISGIPEYIGQIAVVAGEAYIAVGTSSSANWKKVT